jgi:hypothetical protein
MVTLILMIVISLIVIGFAQISRRNARQALDRQLNTQAFYAAETGVNDVRDLIKAATQAGNSVPAKADCTPGSGATAAFYAGLSPDLDASASVKYTCVMVNPTPDTLLYGNVGGQSLVIPVISASGSNINSIKLTWRTNDSTTTPTVGCPTAAMSVYFSPTSSWTCGYGVLRVDLVPTNGTFDSASLQARTMTTFLVPFSTGGITSTVYAAGGSNNRMGIDCSNTECPFTIDTSSLGVNQFYMRISSIYKEVSLQLNAYDASGASLLMQGAQAVIDSTGKAQDVLRRIQVHVPLTPSSENSLSDYALQSSEALCKRFIVMDSYFDNQVTGVTSTNPLCQP